MTPFEDRLNQVLDRLTSDDLLKGSGLGNELAFYLFDYPPEKELVVRGHVHSLLNLLPKKAPGVRYVHINLFNLLIQYLQNRKLLDRVFSLQSTQGNAQTLKALKGPLDPVKIASFFAEEVRPQEYDLVLISGVGSVYPVMRAHQLLNNLHPLMGNTPLVMFYPGVYSGQGLRLYGRLKEKNYYRAFRLVP